MRDYDARNKGKKVAIHHSTGAPGRTIAVDIRLDGAGKFHAHYNEAWYQSDTVAELKKLIDGAVGAQGATEWSYFIEISKVKYDGSEKRSAYGGREARIILVCDFKAIRRSQKLTPAPGEVHARYSGDNNEPYYLIDDVKVAKDGELIDDNNPSRERASYGAPEVLVPFTLERWRALEQIAAATRALGVKLAEMLNGKKTDVSGFLDDTAGVARLLPMPAAERKRA